MQPLGGVDVEASPSARTARRRWRSGRSRGRVEQLDRLGRLATAADVPGARASRPASRRGRRARLVRAARRGAARRGSPGCRRRGARPPCRYVGAFGATLQMHGHAAGELRRCRARVKSTLGLLGGGEQVQHGVGRAAHRDVERHRVLEGRAAWRSRAAARTRRPRRSSAWRARRRCGRRPRTAPCGRCGWRASSRCRAGRGRAPRSGSSSSWR